MRLEYRVWRREQPCSEAAYAFGPDETGLEWKGVPSSHMAWMLFTTLLFRWVGAAHDDV